MANEEKKNYPLLPIIHWWNIRDKFKQSIPGVVTDSYLASILNIEKNSARVNIIPTLKQIGLIDDDGKTTEAAREWRDDTMYPKVCENLKKKIYPKELFDAFTDPLNDRDGVVRWFAHHTGNGNTAVNKMVAFYLLLIEANPIKKSGIQKKETNKTNQKKDIKSDKIKKDNKVEPKDESSIKEHSIKKNKPDININLEIHISADASEDQINKIFESMAKYIYRD